ncbi:CopG family antitoxin [Sphingobium bisphenolivorans]|uniref:CopG family antitoxin n=1 Tax=Sphingobium bisphenolivorans TaxID=1335760 RepID=UPI0003A096A0|nr:BrnA antitoxin family protein [Sphingobium bisphenolivorans]
MSKDKPLPLLSSNEEAEDFVGSADLTGYDLSALTPTRFEFSSKDARVNMRLPAELLDQVKATAASKGMPYQRFIRLALEQALHR